MPRFFIFYCVVMVFSSHEFLLNKIYIKQQWFLNFLVFKVINYNLKLKYKSANGNEETDCRVSRSLMDITLFIENSSSVILKFFLEL